MPVARCLRRYPSTARRIVSRGSRWLWSGLHAAGLGADASATWLSDDIFARGAASGATLPGAGLPDAVLDPIADGHLVNRLDLACLEAGSNNGFDVGRQKFSNLYLLPRFHGIVFWIIRGRREEVRPGQSTAQGASSPAARSGARSFGSPRISRDPQATGPALTTWIPHRPVPIAPLPDSLGGLSGGWPPITSRRARRSSVLPALLLIRDSRSAIFVS